MVLIPAEIVLFFPPKHDVYSSIEEHQRSLVIERCYWPLLNLAEDYKLPLGIEASGLTLEIIQGISPAWIAKLRELWGQNLVEFVGSGYSQLISPLVPAEVAAEDNIDAAVFGEGENTLIDLLNHWRRSSAPLAGMPSVAVKRDGQVFIGPRRKLVGNLDDLGWPNKGASYNSHGYIKQDNYGRVAHSRGCPFQCTFCASSSILGRKVRWRSAKDTVAEMVALYKEYDTRFFNLQDDTFTMDRERTFDFLDQLIASGLPEIPGFRWRCITRPELVESTMLGKMKRAGLAVMGMGIESGNARILGKMKKRNTPDDARRAVRLIKDAGVVASGLFMVGLPTETEAEMWDTVRLAEELECETVGLSVTTAFPDTVLYDEAIELGLFPKKGIDYAAGNNDGVLMTVEKDGRHLPMPYEERMRILGEIQRAFEVIEAKAGDAKLRSRLKYESQYMPQD